MMLLQPPSGRSTFGAKSKQQTRIRSARIDQDKGDTGLSSFTQKKKERRRSSCATKTLFSPFSRPPLSLHPSCLFFLLMLGHLSLSLWSLVSLTPHALSPKKKNSKSLPPRWGSNVMKKRKTLFYFFPSVVDSKSQTKKTRKNPSTFSYLPATFLAAATTASLVMPNLAYSTSAGADAPKESMPICAPSEPV